MSDWWLGLPAAQATVACGGETHSLRWEAGTLAALDHDDPEGERTLAALGGERCACVDVLDAWARHTADLGVLVLASRAPTDPLAALEEGRRWAPRGRKMRSRRGAVARSVITVARPVSAPPAMEPEDELQALLGLGGGLPDRLAATVAAAWAQRLTEEGAERELPRLQAALYGRAAAALRSWLGEPDLRVKLGMGESAPLSRTPRTISVELPFSWLVDVWAKGLTTVWGRFCLGAASEDGLRWTLTTVGPDLGEPKPVVIELPPAG